MPTKKKRSLTRPYTLREFMKAHTKLKISDDTIEDLIRELDALGIRVTKLSDTHSRHDDMKTIMPHHLEKALDEILRRGSLSVEEIVQKIEPLSIVELSQLTQAIKKRAQDLLKPRRGRKKK